MANKHLLNDPKIKAKGYELVLAGGHVPFSPDDKILQGIDGLYINTNQNSNIKYVINESKYNTASLGKVENDQVNQMSDKWVKDRILKAVGGDEKLYKDILNAFDKGEVAKVLTKVQPDGTITTELLDGSANVIGNWV